MPSAKLPPRRSQESLRGIPYEDTSPAQPPIPITHPARPNNKTINRLRKSRSFKQLATRTQSPAQDDPPRDSGLQTPPSSARPSRSTLRTGLGSRSSSIRKSASLPSFRAHRDSRPPSNPKTPRTPTGRASKDSATPAHSDQPDAQASPKPFMGILTEIPTGSFEDLTQAGSVDFSKRGSMLLGGKKAVARREDIANGRVIGSRRTPSANGVAPKIKFPSRILSTDEEALSYKVRSMYEDGGVPGGEWPLPAYTPGNGTAIQNSVNGSPSIRVVDERQPANGNTPREMGDYGPATERIHRLLREANEVAGGIEDWENINSNDVDRYGFIVPRKYSSPSSSMHSGNHSPDPPRIHRTSTLLQLASETPRRSHSRRSRNRSTASPARSAETSSFRRPDSSQSSHASLNSRPTSRLRTATNRLPHNKNRRCVDEAGDMLTLPPGLADIAEADENGVRVDELKVREWERDEKWRKMAKTVKKDAHGGGTIFEFDTRNPKVIERTWKGIPDKWRASAWHSFLATSARKRKDSPSDEELKATFEELVELPSPDDMQIDIDVPRTISSHIMFRRRYRGGQRLLFRVLHCMSIYFPDTGYVQGMAALVATLLCYFDEEMTFVMMVRMWQLRGLDMLYRSGFAGLMGALDEFERDWLRGDEVSRKMTDLGVSPTSYGTRWYLTLFNYSIPFPAQLRVWDVFMLLGDPSVPYPVTSINSVSNGNASPPASAPGPANTESPTNFNGGLDVLHAVSAALIDGLREILLDSDFENAMKTLTSWIPVRDEEMLMRVARVEWKTKRRR